MLIKFTRRRAKRGDTGVPKSKPKKIAMLLIGGIVLFSQLLSPLQAEAISDYDNTVEVESQLVVDNPSDAYDAIDITSNYMGYITGTSSAYNECGDSCKEYISGSFDGGSWFVSQVYSGSPYARSYVCAFFTQETGNSLEFFSNSTYERVWFTTLPSDFRRVCLYSNGAGGVNTLFDSSDAARRNIANSFSDTRPYVNTFPVIYPSGYEGVPIPDLAGPLNILRPNIVADVNNKHVSIMSKRNNNILVDYKIYWFITNATFDDPPPDFEPFSLEGYSEPDNYLEFDIPKLNETISIQANFVGMDGEPIDPPEGYEFRPSLITLVPDGSIYSVDTDGMVCDDNDSCSYAGTEWEDEPCDLLNLGGCVANIWHYIQVVLGIEKTHGNPTGSPFVTFSTGTYGFTAVVAAPMSFINSLATPGGCTTIYFQNPIPGGDNMAFTCIRPLLQSLGTVFTIYQTLILGFTAYWVGVRILGLIMDAKRPQNDRIEVHDL